MKKIVVSIMVITILALGFLLSNAGERNPMNMQSSNESEKSNSNTVVIENYKFSPSVLRVKKGTTVTWKNLDIAKHTITSDNAMKNEISSPLIGKNQEFTYTFTALGTYAYHCEPHPYMKGTVEVIE